MLCVACAQRWRSAGGDAPELCLRCESGLEPAPHVLVRGHLIRAAYWHEGTARTLIHRFKYQGVRQAADAFVRELAADVVGPLVPVPRVPLRASRYGVDPAAHLARRLAEISGMALVDALMAPTWKRRNAGASRRERAAPAFLTRRAPAARSLAGPGSIVLVDDVVTTGATMTGALAALAAAGVERARVRMVAGTVARPTSNVGVATPVSAGR